MSFIALLLFVSVIVLVVYIVMQAVIHLMNVLGWISTDVAVSVSKTIEEAIEQREKQIKEREIIKKDECSESEEDEDAVEEEENEDTKIGIPIPRRAALKVAYDEVPEIAAAKEAPPEVVRNEVQEREIELPRRKKREEESIQLKKPKVSEQKKDEEVASIFSIIGMGIVNLILLIADFIFWCRDAYLRIIPALKTPYPFKTTVWYFKMFSCALPLVIFFRVPDVYGYSPAIHALWWGAVGYAALIALIYSLRIVIPLDLEVSLSSVNLSKLKDGRDSDKLTNIRRYAITMLVTAVSIVIVVKLIWLGFFVIGFMYSTIYFMIFKKKGDSSFTLRRFIASWLIFAAFTAVAIAVFYWGGVFETAAGIALALMVFLSLVFIQTLWMMSRKFELKRGMEQIGLKRSLAWLNIFASPLWKILVSIPFVYFVILFFSVNTTGFLIVSVLVIVGFIVRGLLGDKLPQIIPGGVFSAYMLLVWASIFFVQSYNRIPPTASECDAVNRGRKVEPVWTIKDYARIPKLKNTLPYDSIYDKSTGDLFVTFKNLSGYGSVVRIDEAARKFRSLITTNNDIYPGDMLYPERLCMNRRSKKLYSTTKSRGNFQILNMSYKNELNLDGRIHFPNYETTNCEVDEENGDIYTIFLGPPYSQIRILDGDNGDEYGAVRFGRFGYADYFVMDKERNRLIVPSLDPTNGFDVYVVKGLSNRNYVVTKNRITLNFSLPFGKIVSMPVPTLGIAFNAKENIIYFTCPFLRLVIEVDGETFKTKRYLIAGRFPRELAYNETTGKLYVANYGEGTVDVVDAKKFKITNKIKVGKLVRSLVAIPEDGGNMVVTACGVYKMR